METKRKQDKSPGKFFSRILDRKLDSLAMNKNEKSDSRLFHPQMDVIKSPLQNSNRLMTKTTNATDTETYATNVANRFDYGIRSNNAKNERSKSPLSFHPSQNTVESNSLLSKNTFSNQDDQSEEEKSRCYPVEKEERRISRRTRNEGRKENVEEWEKVYIQENMETKHNSNMNVKINPSLNATASNIRRGLFSSGTGLDDDILNSSYDKESKKESNEYKFTTFHSQKSRTDRTKSYLESSSDYEEDMVTVEKKEEREGEEEGRGWGEECTVKENAVMADEDLMRVNRVNVWKERQKMLNDRIHMKTKERKIDMDDDQVSLSDSSDSEEEEASFSLNKDLSPIPSRTRQHQLSDDSTSAFLHEPSAPPITELLNHEFKRSNFEDSGFQENSTNDDVELHGNSINSHISTPESPQNFFSKNFSKPMNAEEKNFEKNFSAASEISYPEISNNPYPSIYNNSSNHILNETELSCTSLRAVPPISNYSNFSDALPAVVAYDACVRLCLLADTRGIPEPRQFLKNGCMLLRDSFGLNQLFLQPGGMKERGEGEGRKEGDEVSNQIKKKTQRVVKIQIRRTKFNTKSILPKMNINNNNNNNNINENYKESKNYMKHVSGLLKDKMFNLKYSSNDNIAESCYFNIKLKSMLKEEVKKTVPSMEEFITLFPESHDDDIEIDVFDMKGWKAKSILPLSSLNDDNQIHVQWISIFHENGYDCMGKVQVAASYYSNGSDNLNKCHVINECTAYDCLMEVVLRAVGFDRRRLKIDGEWRWMLSEFASVYSISSTYVYLRYLVHIMEASTPTNDCLSLIHELLSPVIDFKNKEMLSRQEKRMLSDVDEQISGLLAHVFESYKCLDETVTAGISPTFTTPSSKLSPALSSAVKIFSLLNDMSSPDAQSTLRSYFQAAASKRCNHYLAETDDIFSFNSDTFLSYDDASIMSLYAKMESTCNKITEEIKKDIEIQDQHIFPSFIDLPTLTSEIYLARLQDRLVCFLRTCPPPGPSPYVRELLHTTTELENNASVWGIQYFNGCINAKELWFFYIEKWMDDMRISLLELCKSDKWMNSIHQKTEKNSSSPFIEEIYSKIQTALTEFDSILSLWPELTVDFENAICDVERTALSTLEKHYAEFIFPLKENNSPKKFTLQKFTRRKTNVRYTVPPQVGVILNSIRRLLEILRPKMEAQMRSWTFNFQNSQSENAKNNLNINSKNNLKHAKSDAQMVVNPKSVGNDTQNAKIAKHSGNSSQVTAENLKNWHRNSNAKAAALVRWNEVTVELRAKYKNLMMLIVEKLAENSQTNRQTHLLRILQDAKDESGDDLATNVRPLVLLAEETIGQLDSVLNARVFVSLCRGLWDRLARDVLVFLENRTQDLSWYKGYTAGSALEILDDVFRKNMQRLQERHLQEKDLEPPRSVCEARSLLCKGGDNLNGVSDSYSIF